MYAPLISRSQLHGESAFSAESCSSINDQQASLHQQANELSGSSSTATANLAGGKAVVESKSITSLAESSETGGAALQEIEV
jgi:hypothetical protein